MFLVKESKALSKILKEVVDEIPLNCRGNYQRNIDTLEIKSDSYKASYAYYSPKENCIYLNTKEMKNHSFKSQVAFNIFILKHEINHAFSTKYDEETKKVTSGFGENEFWFLTEGFTDFMSCSINNKVSPKNLAHSLASQLTLIVGENIMMDAYYNNLGLNPIKEELVRQGIEKKEVDNFFAIYFSIQDQDCKTVHDTLMLIEGMLLNFCDNKLKKLERTNDKRMLLERFKAFLPIQKTLKKNATKYDIRNNNSYGELNRDYSIMINERLKKLHTG